MSLHIELPWTISKAEGIYYQLMSVADQLSDSVRTIIGLELLNKTSSSDMNGDEASGNNSQARGDSDGSRRNSSASGNVKFGDNEVSFERGLDLSYM